MAKVGRKKVLNDDSYLEAVRKTNTMDDFELADQLHVGRSTVYRYRLDPKNKEVIEEAEKYIIGIMNLDKVNIEDFKDLDKFMKIPIIEKWIDLMNRRDVKEKTQRKWVSAFRNICLYFRKHPRVIDLEDVVNLVIDMKELHYKDKKQIEGLSYLPIREAVRGFYMSVHGMSGQYLTSLGVDKKAPNKSGQLASQFIPKDVRHRLIEVLKNYAKTRNEYLELVMICKMMFYTASRISGTIRFNFQVYNYEINPDFWILTIEDKGRGQNRFKDKFFTHNALNDLRTYIRERFKIEPLEAVKKVDYLFPSFVSENGKLKSSKVSTILRKALIESGLPYKEFQPAHIFRHTFAQTFLRASGWNYELCCIIGGWDSPKILEKHYGKMSKEAKVRHVKIVMGLEPPVHEEVILEW